MRPVRPRMWADYVGTKAQDRRAPPFHHGIHLKRNKQTIKNLLNESSSFQLARNIPMTLKYFTQYGIVRLLGHSTFATSMISAQIPTTNLHNAILGIIEIWDSVKRSQVLIMLLILQWNNKITWETDRDGQSNRHTFPTESDAPIWMWVAPPWSDPYQS